MAARPCSDRDTGAALPRTAHPVLTHPTIAGEELGHPLPKRARSFPVDDPKLPQILEHGFVECPRQSGGALAVPFQQVECHALCRLGADTGKAAQCVDEIVALTNVDAVLDPNDRSNLNSKP